MRPHPVRRLFVNSSRRPMHLDMALDNVSLSITGCDSVNG
jgi:hypothetical protein